MVVVAVAGGTGSVGRTIVQALVNSRNHTVFVLSRTTAVQTSSDAQHLVADYDSVSQIESVLRDHNIDTVVSALVLLDSGLANSQINLIRGAARSSTVTKFLPSEYHLDFYAPVDGIELAFKNFQLEAIEELKQHPQLTWSLIRNGLFLDYLGMPYHAKPTNMAFWSVFVDLKHELCVFPGDGNQIMTFTHSTDLAAFVERLVGVSAKEWPRESLISSNRLTLNDIAPIIRQITGRDFTIIHDPAEAVHSGHITQLPSNKPLFEDASLGEAYQMVEKEAMFTTLSNGYDLRGGKNLADMFPDVPMTNITDFLKQSWALRLAQETTGR